MHYKNGREAKNGDKVMLIPSYGAPVVGILYDAQAGNDYCNGRIAPVSPASCTRTETPSGAGLTLNEACTPASARQSFNHIAMYKAETRLPSPRSTFTSDIFSN